MIVVAFHTTADAFGFEAVAKGCGFPGHLGTIPRSISAGCGFAWLTSEASRFQVEEFLLQQELEYEGVYER